MESFGYQGAFLAQHSFLEVLVYGYLTRCTSPAESVGGVMVVGHNFDSEAGFAYSFNRGGENLQGPT